MNVVPLAPRTEMMDQRIISEVWVRVLSEPMKFLLSNSPSKEMGDLRFGAGCFKHDEKS